MRLVAVFFAFCVVAFCQNAPDNNLPQAGKMELLDKLNAAPQDAIRKRLESMKLLSGPHALQPHTLVVTSAPAKCAIPLLNALPAEGKVDYRLQVVKPAAGERGSDKSPRVGIPACK